MMYPHWFGSQAESLFGTLTTPATGPSDAGVLIVPPLGLEAVTTYRGLRYLSQLLAGAGLTTLRYDHRGTGSSVGSPLADNAWDGWVAGVGEAAEHMRTLGVTDLTIVGVRAGAFFVDAAATGAERIVYLDPPQSGRRWMREITSLQLMGVGQCEDDPGVSAPGLQISGAAADRLRAHRWSPNPEVPRLVAARPGAAESAAQRALVAGAAELIELTEAELFTAPEAFIHHVPAADLRRLSAAIVSALGREARPVAAASAVIDGLRMTAEVASRHGVSILERIDVRTSRELVTFTTFADGESPRGTVLFESTANEPAWGPTDMWVHAAREHAGGGLQCVRHDKTGGGEAGRVDPDEIAVLYSHESRDDAEAIARSLETAPADTLLVGLCSGAWMAAETALRTRAGSVLLFGMLQWARVREPVDKKFLADHGYDLDTMSIPEATSEHLRHDWRAMAKSILRDFFPIRLWEELGRRGITQVPGPLLQELDEAGVRTTVMMTPDDLEHYTTHRGDESLRRIRRHGWGGRLLSIDVPLGDHNLYRHDSRAQAGAALRAEVDHLRRRIGVIAERPAPPAPRALFCAPPDTADTADAAAWREALSACSSVRAEFLDTRRLGAIGRFAVAPVPVLGAAGADLLALRHQLVGRVAARRRLAERLSRGDIDVVHLCRPTFAWPIAPLVRRIPLVVTVDRADLPEQSASSTVVGAVLRRVRSRRRARALRAVAREAKHVVATSEDVARYLRGPEISVPGDIISVLTDRHTESSHHPVGDAEAAAAVAHALALAVPRPLTRVDRTAAGSERHSELTA